MKHSKGKAGKLKTLTISLIAGANVATIVLLWICCFSTYVSPALHPRFTQLGILFPFFLLLNIAFIFVWLLTEKKGIILTVLGLFSCMGFILDYYSVSIESDLPEDAIKVLSYNVCNFTNNDSLELNGLEVARFIERSEADIICLQEYTKTAEVSPIIDKMIDSLHYECRNANGLAIFSKFPFVGDTVYCSHGSCGNGSLAWKIKIDDDTITVIDNHLQSNSISMEERAEYGNAISGRNRHELKASGKIMLSRLSQAAGVRSVQADSICAIIDRHETKDYLVCGDFNDTPISYSYQEVSKRLKNAFRESGNGLGVSFKQKGFMVRIDNIFVSSDWKTYRTRIESENDCSDHYPIVTYISK